MKAGVLDANVLLRFFLQDHPNQSSSATALFRQAHAKDIELFLLDTTVAEVTFVMEKVYKRPRIQIAEALLDFIHNPFVVVQNTQVLSDALTRYGKHPVDFPDALVAATAADRQVPAVSFDKDLNRFSDITRYEPRS